MRVYCTSDIYIQYYNIRAGSMINDEHCHVYVTTAHCHMSLVNIKKRHNGASVGLYPQARGLALHTGIGSKAVTAIVTTVAHSQQAGGVRLRDIDSPCDI